jgi:radical SAM superfamily enzyme YgiQ (UPF0313 family)
VPKILFIQPTQYDNRGGLCKQKIINLPGLVFPLLSALTPSNWNVDLLLEVVDDINYDSDADIVAIGTMGHTIFRGIEIAREYRKQGKKVVMGGYMASLAVSEVIHEVDTVIVGDAEIAYPRMLEDFEKNGELKPVYDYPIRNLDALPVPHYDLLLEKPIGNMLPVQAGRGCPYNCSFCSIACLYKGKYFFRPVDEVIRDIEVVKGLGFKRFYMIDDNIASNPGYLTELCGKLKKLKMKWASQCALHLAGNADLLRSVRESGCDLMSLGVESLSQEGINKLNKAWLKTEDHTRHIKTLARAGIVVSTEMIVGTDYDTEESIRSTYRFIEQAKVPIPRFYILTPIPGTELFRELKKENRLVTEDFEKYDGVNCVHIPERIKPEKLTDLYWWLNRKVFSAASIIHRIILNRHLWKNLKMMFLSLAVNLHYRRYVYNKIPPNIF